LCGEKKNKEGQKRGTIDWGSEKNVTREKRVKRRPRERTKSGEKKEDERLLGPEESWLV